MIRHTGSEFTFSTEKGPTRVIFKRAGKGERNAPAWSITIYVGDRFFKRSVTGRQPSPAWAATILEEVFSSHFTTLNPA